MVFKDMERVAGFFNEFWKFAAKGNAVQLAVAVVLGGAFGAIVNSLLTDIITPLLSLATNNVDFSKWGLVIRGEGVDAATGGNIPPLIIGYGHLIQATLNFFVVGLSIFLIFKLFQGVMLRFQKREAEAPPTPPVSNEEKLLVEIRDILKEQSRSQQK
jgi:large conductance mechanosensitive channel